jgi:hypothetical protein
MEEDALWHYLYSMHTHGSKTNWTAFCAEWNQHATLHKQRGSQVIKHKQVQQLQKYHDKVVKEARSQMHAVTGLSLQAGQQQQQQSQHAMQQQAAGGSAAAGMEQQPYQQQQQHHAGLDSTAAAAAAAGAAAAAAGSGLYAGGFDTSQLYSQQQLFMGAAVMPDMPAGGAAGFYGMPAAAMTAAAPHAGFAWGMAGQGFPLGGFNPAAAVYDPGAAAYGPAAAYDPTAVAAKRAAWAASRLQRGQPVKAPRQHRKHRCNKCWRELAGGSKQHKNGKDDWAQGLRCPGNCAKCGQPMVEHREEPCPAPEQP